MLVNGSYNALQCSTILQNAPKHQMVVANAITSGNLPGTVREHSGTPLETLHGSSADHLETFGNIPGAVTAIRFYLRDASGTSSGFPSGSFQDPSGNAHFEAMI